MPWAPAIATEYLYGNLNCTVLSGSCDRLGVGVPDAFDALEQIRLLALGQSGVHEFQHDGVVPAHITGAADLLVPGDGISGGVKFPLVGLVGDQPLDALRLQGSTELTGWPRADGP